MLTAAFVSMLFGLNLKFYNEMIVESIQPNITQDLFCSGKQIFHTCMWALGKSKVDRLYTCFIMF